MSAKKRLKIAITDYWKDAVPERLIKGDYFYALLSRNFELELSEDPDLLFFSVFGNEHKRYNCLKVLFTGENRKPERWEYDYSFSFADTDETNMFYPFFVSHPYFWELKNNRYSEDLLKLRTTPKSRFCNFVYSNAKPLQRRLFYLKLRNYHNIDAPGLVLNNMPHLGGGIYDKLNFLKHYKFTIAFENESAKDYTTEKLYHALAVGSIPIYWGNPDVDAWFNPESFINCADFDDFNDVAEKVMEIDRDKDRYLKYLKANPILPNSKLGRLNEAEMVDRLSAIADKARDLKRKAWFFLSMKKPLDINLLTFGDRTHFAPALQRCARQAAEINRCYNDTVFQGVYCVDDSHLEGFSDFWLDHAELILKSPRGYGYWLWKPFLIRQLMNRLEEDAIIFYMDAGCELNHQGIKRMAEYHDYAVTYGGLVFTLKHQVEVHYTKMDTYKRVTGDVVYNETDRQILATALLVKNTPLNRVFIDEWYTICCENRYHYLDDTVSHLKNHELFKEHRHDQSIFSLLVKKYNLFYRLQDETYWGPDRWDTVGQDYPLWAKRNRAGVVA